MPCWPIGLVATLTLCAAFAPSAVAQDGRDAAVSHTPALAPGAPPPPSAPEVISRDAEGRATIRAQRLPAPLRIDGKLDDVAYSLPSFSGFIQAEPHSGQPATERTEAWVFFDDDNLYVVARCWETHPERITANEMRRDSTAIQYNDLVSFSLDTFYDHRNAINFGVSVLGGRTDGQVTDERQFNIDYNPIWNVRTGRFEQGWVMEAAIPFKSLRYRAGREQVWGLIMRRQNRWKNEISYLVPIPQAQSNRGTMMISAAASVVGIEAPRGSRRIEIKPYVTASTTKDRALSTSSTGEANVGGEVKYGITQNLAADFTYNTDFAQVEADEQQVNLTRFSLFFPEKREFFLENGGIFNFGGNTGGNVPVLFYSRRIGLTGSGTVPIEAGGRLTGRAGTFTVGAVNIRTSELGPTPATNFAALRLKRNILRRSNLGAIYTGRSTTQLGGSRNDVYGADGSFSFFSNLNAYAYWARSRTPTSALGGDDASYRAEVDYAGDRYAAQVRYLAVGSHFTPDVGFVRRSDMREVFTQFRFSPRTKKSGTVRKYSWRGSLQRIANRTGRLESRDALGEFAIEFHNADRIAVTTDAIHEFLPRPFAIAPGVSIPVGVYDFANVRAAWAFGQTARFAGEVSVDRGSFYDGNRTILALSGGRVEATPRLSIQPTASMNRVELRAGAFTTTLVGTRATFTMTPLSFASALVQYNSSTHSVASNIRLRWEYQPGSELFVVYNEQRDTPSARLPGLANRAFIVKVNRLVRF